MSQEAMSTEEFESALSALAGVDLLSAIRGAIAGIDADSPDYEAALRTQVVLNGDVLSQECGPDDSDHPIDALQGLMERVLRSGSLPRSEALAPALFVWFEWLNRNDSDRARCHGLWAEMFGLADALSPEELAVLERSIYLYAKSRWLYQVGDMRRALTAAQAASEMAPDHPGFLNNYGEILVGCCKEQIFSEDDDNSSEGRALQEEAAHAAERFKTLAHWLKHEGTYQKYWRPSFIVTCELLSACSSEEGLIADGGGFERARAMLRHLNVSGDELFSDESRYISEMGRISEMQSLFYLIGNVKRMRQIIDEQCASNERISQEMVELDQKVSDNRISIIETLGFFSAIIALIITSVQAGEGLSFGLRALFVLVLLGALLIAFGSLDVIIAPFRKDYLAEGEGGFFARIPSRVKVLWFIGIVVIVLGCALACIPYPL